MSTEIADDGFENSVKSLNFPLKRWHLFKYYILEFEMKTCICCEKHTPAVDDNVWVEQIVDFM